MTKSVNSLPDGFTLGCDPELFIIDTSTGKHVSAHGLIPGNKAEPFAVEGKVNYGDSQVNYKGTIQVDGMALEIGIDPVTTYDQWNGNIIGVLSRMKEMLHEVNPNYAFSVIPSVEFEPGYYDSLPEEAKALGCDPDFNAWEGGLENPSPDGTGGVRGAAGHIHFGWGTDIPVDHPEHIEVCNDFVKHLDNHLGLFSRAIDKDTRRRNFYGKAGAHRRKSYGVEYRVPSNAWLTMADRRLAVFNLSKTAIQNMIDGEFIQSPDAVGIINEDPNAYGPGGSAESLMKANGLMISRGCYGK